MEILSLLVALNVRVDSGAHPACIRQEVILVENRLTIFRPNVRNLGSFQVAWPKNTIWHFGLFLASSHVGWP